MKFKKLISILLTVAIALALAAPAGASQEQSDAAQVETAEFVRAHDYPLVFVHGLGGWGDYDDFTHNVYSYWGGGALDYLKEQGYEAYAASVGPVSSAWDRACELYAQLTGTVTDYGLAHSEAHGHDRYGLDYTGRPLMGEAWDGQSPICLVGHSFGGPASRMFTSLMAYGDEAEVAATGEDTSPLFTGGKDSAVHSVVTLSGVHNGGPIADLLFGLNGFMFGIGMLINFIGATGRTGSMGNIQLSQWGLTPAVKGERVSFSLSKIKNFADANDNAGYDLTIAGARELNKKIKTVPSVYYYSYSGYITDENCFGRLYNKATPSPIFIMTGAFENLLQGKTISGVTIEGDWAIHDGLVPLASAMYPETDKDTAVSYEQALSENNVQPGVWNYLEPVFGVDHGDYMMGMPGGMEEFYMAVAQLSSVR